MEINKVNMVYFSATYTTKKLLEYVAESFSGLPVQKFDITKGNIEEQTFGTNELLLIGAPVYAGRIPAIAAEAFNKIKGNATPAIIVCVYGNRDYDDALLELKNITTNNGFKVVSAGAFIAQHSIFPKMAYQRPNVDDKQAAFVFGEKSWAKIKNADNIAAFNDIQVKGNFPYKVAGPIPLKPYGSSKCNKCGTCVKLCPVEAINQDKPRKTDADKCISCGRCIVVCPQHARYFRGLKYKIASKQFYKAFMQPKAIETFFE